MNKTELRASTKGHLRVRMPDVSNLEDKAHRLRQEISDPRLPINARTNYAEMIQLVDVPEDTRRAAEAWRDFEAMKEKND